MIHWSSAVLIGGLGLAAVSYAATLTIPSAGVTLHIENAIDCNDGSALICITTLETRRAYLLAIEPDGKFVSASYRVLLRRYADQPGLVYYTNRLIGKTITRDGVLYELMASEEYKLH